jgi:large subunit ribosomal protein L23
MKDPRDIILRPVVSEKTYALMEAGTYTFEVHPDATKPEISDAVERIWNVKVRNVNTLNRKGKARFARGTNRFGKRKDVKRAMVTLRPGDQIALFES